MTTLLVKDMIKPRCLGNLQADCDGSCGCYKECLQITIETDMKVEEHRRED